MAESSAVAIRRLVELLAQNSRVDAQRFYKRLGVAPSHVRMTLRF